MLQVNNLRMDYATLVAVDDASFTLEKGQLPGLLGPNGAGKTTTVSMIAGVQLKGDTDPIKRKIGLVPQDLALYDELCPTDNLRFFGALYAMSGTGLASAIQGRAQFGWSFRPGARCGEEFQRCHEAAFESGRRPVA